MKFFIKNYFFLINFIRYKYRYDKKNLTKEFKYHENSNLFGTL